MIGNLLRKLPAFKGKLRIARALINRDKKDISINTQLAKYILPNLRDSQYFELFTNGVYESELVAFIVKTVPPNGVYLDIGGNIGSVAISVALKRPDIQVVTIEALPENFDYLTKNIALNKLTNIKALNICCSNVENEIVKFHIPDLYNGSSSFHGLHTSNYVELTTTTVDILLQKLAITTIDVIKIDTEGSEALVLQGAANTLKNNNATIIFEFCAAYEASTPGLKVGDSQVLLKQNNYNLYNFNLYPAGNKIEEIITTQSFDFLAIKHK